jgi:hypothetical protein
MSNITNLNDYAFAKRMVEEIPLALKDLESCRDRLLKHKAFSSVAETIWNINGAIYHLESRLPTFQHIVDKKGEV